ncbi:putative phospholipid-binding protein MlaC [BD1-7 clade bacterium]|uniref:Putative phospholipid-binding protein MlaC n=1 Tax=BD1-7 clade bacterium TaxID=2029982 RepID=A0A5S9N1A4_9GAMM|nr:putative phospholipid-binding protein MlaC [BD1-7 clade bacterium]
MTMNAMFKRRVALYLWLVAGCFVPLVAQAKAVASEAPHQLISQTTDKLLVLIDGAKDYFDKNPQRYFEELSVIVEPMIDFNSFTRGVMGEYGTRDYYRSLSPEQRRVFKADYKRFVATFREGLMQTYGKGLLAFNGEKVVVEPPSEKDLQQVAAGKTVEVLQIIKGNDKSYEITYKMRPNKAGEWKLRNVTIDAINVGQLYRKQFAAAMDKYQGDLGKVISNWIEESSDAEKEAQKVARKNASVNSQEKQ